MPSSLSLHRKLAEVMTEAETIPKSGTAPAAMGGFKFVQVGDAAKAIREALGKRHISMLPTSVEIIGQSEHQTKSGGTMTTVELRTTWTLTDGESGESITIQSYGAGADTGDKYSGKAQTNAMKYALLMGFLLSTGDDPEMNDSSDRRNRVLTAKDGRPDAQPVAPVFDRDPGGITGTAEIGTAKDSDFQLRETPDGWALGFRLVSDKGGIKVIARDAIAQALAGSIGETVGKRITVWGRIRDEEFTNKGGRKIKYQVLEVERIRAPEYELPATIAPGQEALLLGEPTMPDTLSPEELAAIRDRSEANRTDDGYYIASSDRRDLLAHIDALTAAVREAAETLEPYSRDKMLAVLGGES